MRNLGNQDDSDRRGRPAILPVWMHSFSGAYSCSFQLYTRYRTKPKGKCLLVGGRNNLLAQSRDRFRRRPALLNTLGTLFGGLAVFFPPSDGWVVRIFFLATVATNSFSESVNYCRLRNNGDVVRW